jgi:hypothetical protein
MRKEVEVFKSLKLIKTSGVIDFSRKVFDEPLSSSRPLHPLADQVAKNTRGQGARHREGGAG